MCLQEAESDLIKWNSRVSRYHMVDMKHQQWKKKQNMRCSYHRCFSDGPKAVNENVAGYVHRRTCRGRQEVGKAAFTNNNSTIIKKKKKTLKPRPLTKWIWTDRKTLPISLGSYRRIFFLTWQRHKMQWKVSKTKEINELNKIWQQEYQDFFWSMTENTFGTLTSLWTRQHRNKLEQMNQLSVKFKITNSCP